MVRVFSTQLIHSCVVEKSIPLGKSMASTAPLTGSELIDCAKANSPKGVEIAASRCGYGEDISAFEAALHKAGEHLGIEINRFEDLLHSAADREDAGVEVPPESPSDL
jgi:hypothetical protein